MHGRRYAWMAMWLVAFGLLLSPPSRAATLEGLLMPGPLASAHAKQEDDCGSCHDRTNRARQRQLCQDCHKDVADDISARRGLHGLREDIRGAQCSACHSEHRGRDARITPVTASGFDHSRTDFVLENAHRQVPCESCHQSGKLFREAPGKCVDCHSKAEPHEGKLGTDCAACHNTRTWSEFKFDHDKTRFALRGSHTSLPCAGCHAGNRWKDIPRACASCHTPDDVHRGERGTDCGSCHTQQSWKDAKFDHEKETGFALVGAHQAAACQSCHRTGRFQDEIPKDCIGCHRAIDSHAGRMGTDCASCHNQQKWSDRSFDHERDAHFVLSGAHAELGCHRCHIAPLADSKPPQDCIGCHRGDDAHAGSAGTGCASCHGTSAWRTGLKFDHDLTEFPLLGQHAIVPCANCHASLKFGETDGQCSTCHRADDVHKGNLGQECARCHHPNAWNQWEFDHAKEAGFALSGAHASLQCGSCHRRPPGEEKLGKDCVACHSTDDVHLGQFGRRCETCHSTISFHRARPQ